MWDNSVYEKIMCFVLVENEYIFSGDMSVKL